MAEFSLIPLCHVVTIVAVYVGFRLSVAMGAAALKHTDWKDPVFIPNKIYRNLTITFLLLYIGSELFIDARVSGFIAVGVGLVLLAKLKELHYLALLRRAYFQLYYALQLLGGAGYLWLGWRQIAVG